MSLLEEKGDLDLPVADMKTRREFITTGALAALAGVMGVKAQSGYLEELIVKWKPVLEYTSKFIPPLDPSRWGYVAYCMEKAEKTYLKKPGARLLKLVIPAIRKKEGPVRVERADGMWIVHDADFGEDYYCPGHLEPYYDPKQKQISISA